MTETATLEGVPIPFANTELLLRTKQTPRERDRLDLQFVVQRRSGIEEPNE